MNELLKRTFISAILAVLIITTVLATPLPVQAASIIYVNTRDDQYGGQTQDRCSLREAVVSANMNAAFGGCAAGGTGTDTILIPPGVYTLDRLGANEDKSATGDLDILSSVSIVGSGSSPEGTTIQGMSDRVFHVKAAGTVTINSLTITSGNVTGGAEGAGIYNDHSTLTLNDVVIASNMSENLGGGISNTTGSSLTINNSTLTLNSAATGGGIYNGGILFINNSLLSANTATSTGGGIDNNPYLANETARLVNTTIAINTAKFGSGISNSGTGGTSNYGIKLIHSTVVHNVKGAGFVNEPNSKALFQNSIIALHENNINCSIASSSTVVSFGYNLESAHTCGLAVKSGDFIDVTDPLLGETLEDNGGPTQTYSLQPGSPALDKVPLSLCQRIDQRLYGRPGNGLCDIGAFELDGSHNQVLIPILFK